MLGLIVVSSIVAAAAPTQPLDRAAEPIEIAAPFEPATDEVVAPPPRVPVLEYENYDARPKLPDPYRRKIGAVLLAAGAVAFTATVGAQAGAPWKFRHCYFVPKEQRGDDANYMIPDGEASYRAGECPYTTLATWAHPIAFAGTLAASILTGIGISRFGEVAGARRARRDLAPRSGAVRLAIGGTLTAVGIVGVFASVLGPDRKSRDCDDAPCMHRLAVASSVAVSVGASTAVVGSGLLGHAFGERRAARRPGHIAYGLGLDARGLQLSAAARF